MMDTSDEAETKSGTTPEQKAERQNARRIGRIVLAHSHKAAHPDATGPEIREAVAAQKALQVNTGKQVLKALQKAGMTISFTEPAES